MTSVKSLPQPVSGVPFSDEEQQYNDILTLAAIRTQ